MASTTTLNFTADALENMSYRELQACAKANGAKASGKTVELRSRLSAMLERAAAGPLAELPANSPNHSFKEFTMGAGPVHESPMKVHAGASPTTAQMEADTDVSDTAELPSPIDEDSAKFPNDGTFLDMFKALEKEQQDQPWEAVGGESLENFAGLRASKVVAESPTASPHSQAVERMNRKKASAEEQEEDNEEQELEDAMIAARAVAAVRQAEEMAAEPAVRTHTKFDDEGNVVTTYEEQVYDSDGVLRGASSSEEEDDTIGEEMMATIMDAAAAMETIEFTSGDPESPVATRRDITATEWRGTHTRFDDENEVDEMVVGRNKNATTSGKSKGAAVRVSDSPAVSRTRTKPTVKVEVEEMDDLASSMGASTLGQ